MLDFEDLLESTIVQAQYASRGVVGKSALIIARHGRALPAHSGEQVLSALVTEFVPPDPIRLRFTSGQSTVSLFAGAADVGVPLRGTLTAFDANNAVVATDGPKPVTAGAGETSTTVVAAAIGNAIFDATGARIRQVPFTPERVKAALAARNQNTD